MAVSDIFSSCVLFTAVSPEKLRNGVLSACVAVKDKCFSRSYGGPFVKILYLTDLAQKVLSLCRGSYLCQRQLFLRRDSTFCAKFVRYNIFTNGAPWFVNSHAMYFCPTSGCRVSRSAASVNFPWKKQLLVFLNLSVETNVLLYLFQLGQTFSRKLFWRLWFVIDN